MECPELGGDGEARVEDVMDEGMKPRPVLSLPREDGGMGGLSKATLTRLSISSARNSVFSFSSWINLVFNADNIVIHTIPLTQSSALYRLAQTSRNSLGKKVYLTLDNSHGSMIKRGDCTPVSLIKSTHEHL